MVKDEDGRTLLLLAEIQGHRMILSNVYAPNIDDPTFFGNLECKISDMGDYPILIAGDFNLVMDDILDRSTPSQRHSRSASVAIKMCRTLGLVDVWRVFNPSARDYTFYSAPHNTLSRIDYFLVSNSIMPSAMSCSIGSIHVSDHAPVLLHLSSFGTPPKSPRWRLNSSLLHDSNFLQFSTKGVKNGELPPEAGSVSVQNKRIRLKLRVGQTLGSWQALSEITEYCSAVMLKQFLHVVICIYSGL